MCGEDHGVASRPSSAQPSGFSRAWVEALRVSGPGCVGPELANCWGWTPQTGLRKEETSVLQAGVGAAGGGVGWWDYSDPSLTDARMLSPPQPSSVQENEAVWV